MPIPTVKSIIQNRRYPPTGPEWEKTPLKTFLLRDLLTAPDSPLFLTTRFKMADIQSLKQALAVSPDNVPLLLMLGDAYLDQFSLEDARATYEAALRVDPANPVAKTHLAQLLDLDGRSSEAILRVEQVCSESPNFAPAWSLRARFYLNENRAREAREFYDRAVAIDPAMKNEELLKRIQGIPAHNGTVTGRPGLTTTRSSKRTILMTIPLMTTILRSNSIKNRTWIFAGSAVWKPSKRTFG